MRALLMATRGWDEPEAEPIEIDTEAEGLFVLDLDDGDRLGFNAVEADLLHAALTRWLMEAA